VRIANFNINNINKRLDNLLAWLAKAEPDVVSLQELKAEQGAFPVNAHRTLGYEAVWQGECSWNGVAILARNHAPYVPMDLVTQDQKRADVWITELQRYVRDGNMPQLEVIWLPMDHLAAGRPGKCTPRACMADNDLALGRIVQALSHSPYWKDTVIFVVEDDAQAGPDHTDSHRTPFYAISAYNRSGCIASSTRRM